MSAENFLWKNFEGVLCPLETFADKSRRRVISIEYISKTCAEFISVNARKFLWENENLFKDTSKSFQGETRRVFKGKHGEFSRRNVVSFQGETKKFSRRKF